MQAKLTLLIATYNRHTLTKNLLLELSGLLQTNLIRIIIVNDGGEGGKSINGLVKAINNKYGETIKFIDRKTNLGIFKTRGELLTELKNNPTKYFMFLDDDDHLNTINLYNWLLSDIDDTFNQHVFNLIEYHYNDNSNSVRIDDRQKYYSTKTKLPYSLNSVIYNYDSVKSQLDNTISKLYDADRFKNIGEDVYLAYWITDEGKLSHPRVYNEDLTLLNYNMSINHMAFTDRDVNYVPGVNKMRIYTKMDCHK